MKTKPQRKEHEAWVLWAALCAEHVLPYFEKECPTDDRPRKAIEEARRRWPQSANGSKSTSRSIFV